MKKFALFIAFTCLGSLVLAQDATIVKPGAGETEYRLENNQEEHLTATESIDLLEGVWIKQGAIFSAKIIGAIVPPLARAAYTSVNLNSVDENYVYTRNYQSAMDSFRPSYEDQIIEQIAYFDGLGRPMQQVAIKASDDRKDIVTHIGYDGYGRQVKEFLPYEELGGTLGNYRSGAEAGTLSYYTNNYAADLDANAPNPFSEKAFDGSPLNRVTAQAAPGEDWKLGGGHEIRLEYQVNATNEVRRFDVTFSNNNTEAPSIAANGYYTEGELIKTITKDENWQSGQTHANDHTTEEFTDQNGQVVLKRTYESGTAHDTHYAYDDFGNLTYVLSPKMNGSIANMDKLGYQYRYDYRNRLIEKKIPGKGWEYIVYNKLDQPIMTKDALNPWQFTKYDAFGRVVLTGSANGGTRAQEQDNADSYSGDEWVKDGNSTADGKTLGYSPEGYPSASNYIDLYTVTYYDDYTNTEGLSVPTGTIFGQAIASNLQGLPTVSAVRVLETNDWITTLTAYDSKGRPIYTKSKNPYLDTEDVVETQLDFVGKPVKVKTTHTRGTNAPIVTVDLMEYDHQGRLKRQLQELGGNTELIVLNQYDGIGQLVEKKVGNTTESPLQEVDYAYNIRGWLKGINDVTDATADKLFNFKISYNVAQDPLYNGNISGTQWRTANTDSSLKSFNYSYDALNRITAANGVHNNWNDLRNVLYDKNGNITYLQRYGHINANATAFGNMDVLNYGYDTGNRLLKVTDTGNKALGFKDGTNTNDDYSYDINGNMIFDANKGITAIEYNHLNLPTKVTINGGTIDYVYDATGTKHRKIVSTGTTTDYTGNYIYENGNLRQISQPEGYIEPDGTGYQYVYRYTDIWGNTRITYTDDNNDGNIDASSEIRREQNYYPFGLEHKGYNNMLSGVKNNLKTYQGQEFTEDLGLNTHEWRYRISDPAIGRFWQIDPLAEDYMYNSTYAFQENKMGMGIELEGAELLDWGYDVASKGLDYLENKFSNNANVQRYVGGMRTGLGMTPKGMINGYVSGVSGSINKMQNGNVLGGALEIGLPVGKNLLDAGKTVSKAIDGDPQAQGAVGMMALTSFASRGMGRTPKSSSSVSGALIAEVDATVSHLQATKQSPATVVGAELNGSSSIATSGSIPGKIAPSLQQAANQVGGVGNRNAGNTVGCCAEFRAGNNVLLRNPTAVPSQVNFTNAIRPRTGQTVKPCLNCNTIFKLDSSF